MPVLTVRWLEHDRARKPTTIRDYGSIIKAHLLPAFGGLRVSASPRSTSSPGSARSAPAPR